MEFLLWGFALAAWAIIMTRKDGPFGLIKDLREWVGTPLTCSVCAAFWLWLLGAPLLLWGRLTGALLLQYGGALGVAYAVLALAGALDLDR